MEPSQPLFEQSWYTTRRFFVGAVLVMAVVLAIDGYLAIWVRDNDFLVHRSFGQAFLNGEPAQAGQNHYLLSRGLLNALTAWLPYRVDRAVHFSSALVLLALTLAWWHELANKIIPLDRRRAFAAALFTLALTGSYVIRDLDDCGLQLYLLFFLTAALRALGRGSSLRCGFWLGLAVAYKVTPVLFGPYLVWKRQWKAAGWMVVFALLWNVAPIAYLGWDQTWRCHQIWAAFSARCLAMTDPSQNPLEPPRHLNQGLSVAIARFLQTHPPGHPLWMAHPWFVQFGDLDPAGAKRGVQVGMLLLASVLAWRLRRPLASPAEAGTLVEEWAALTLLCAVLSPLCWLQHLVVILPCVFLWWRAYLGPNGVPSWHRPVMGLFGLIVLTVHREFWTRDVYEVMVSYKLHTLAALLALLLVLTLRHGAMSAAPAREIPAETPLAA